MPFKRVVFFCIASHLRLVSTCFPMFLVVAVVHLFHRFPDRQHCVDGVLSCFIRVDAFDQSCSCIENIRNLPGDLRNICQYGGFLK